MDISRSSFVNDVKRDRIILSRDLKEGMITQSRLISNISVHFVHPSHFGIILKPYFELYFSYEDQTLNTLSQQISMHFLKLLFVFKIAVHF